MLSMTCSVAVEFGRPLFSGVLVGDEARQFLVHVIESTGL
jgi:hypothetical protein